MIAFIHEQMAALTAAFPWLELPLAIFWILIKIIAILVPLILSVAYLTFAERKVIGFMQARIGPNRVGPRGWLQPIADVMKLFLKEIIVPTKANTYLFLLSPMLFLAPSFAAWAVVPFSPDLVLAPINLGILYVLTMSSLSVYGVILGGWASNSKYALLGAMRSAAQIVSYEIAMGFAIIGVIILAGSLNLGDVVQAQAGGVLHWYWLPLLPLLLVYWVSGVAETNRAPFDVAEGESEIVAGFHVEYAGISFGLFFLAEYANMILISVLTATLFFGGWLSPFESIPWLHAHLTWIPGIFWLLLKTSFFLFAYLWLRATFPRYRYDQIMRLGWQVFIPLTFVWVCLVAWYAKTGNLPWMS